MKTRKFLDTRIWDVLERAHLAYTTRCAVLLRIVEGSLIGRSLLSKFKDAWTETEAIELDMSILGSSSNNLEGSENNCAIKPFLIRTTDVHNTYVMQYTGAGEDLVVNVNDIVDLLCKYLDLNLPETAIQCWKDVEIIETSLYHRSPYEVPMHFSLPALFSFLHTGKNHC